MNTTTTTTETQDWLRTDDPDWHRTDDQDLGCVSCWDTTLTMADDGDDGLCVDCRECAARYAERTG